jgi:hypothetical protein
MTRNGRGEEDPECCARASQRFVSGDVTVREELLLWNTRVPSVVDFASDEMMLTQCFSSSRICSNHRQIVRPIWARKYQHLGCSQNPLPLLLFTLLLDLSVFVEQNHPSNKLTVRTKCTKKSPSRSTRRAPRPAGRGGACRWCHRVLTFKFSHFTQLDALAVWVLVAMQ